MEIVLNEVTRTAHKSEPGTSDLHTVCGVTYHLPSEQLEETSLDDATTAVDVSKCGRCFRDAGGY